MAQVCRNCGSEIKEGAKFCAKCGTSVDTPTDTSASAPISAWICLSCGHENKKGKFCAKCGEIKTTESATLSAETSIPHQKENNAAIESPTPQVETSVITPIPLKTQQPDGGSYVSAQSSIKSSVWICPACGHETLKGIFCAKCGGKKPQGDPSIIETPITPALNLAVTKTNNEQSATANSSTSAISATADNQQPDIVSTVFYNLGIACRRIHDTIGDAMPSAASISDFLAKLHNNKAAFFCALIAIVAVFVFFGSGKLADSYYTSKTEECVAIMTESKKFLDDLAGLPGDSTSEDVKKIADGLALNASKLSSIRSGLVGKLPRKPEQEKAWDVIGKNAELLSRAAAVVQSQERAFAPVSIRRFSGLCDECMAKWEEASAAATYATVNSQPLSNQIPYEDVKKDLQAYRRNKQAFDAKYAQDRYNERRKERQAAQEELKKKQEVVFLADNAYKDGNDLILSGRFYNGTGDLVTSVMDMQVDLKVSLFGTEIQSLTDEPCSLQLSGLRLMPQQATDVVQIRLPGKAPEEDFSDFEDHVHKIRWSRMKARS